MGFGLKRYLGLAAAAFLLASCMEIDQPRPLTAVDLSNPQKTGYLVGVIGRTSGTPMYERYELTICNAAHQRVADLSYSSGLGGLGSKEVDEGNFYGDSFSVALPEGQYEICDFAFHAYNVVYRLKQQLSIPVQVAAGKANYIGRYMGVVVRVGSTGVWVVTDNQAQDMPAVLKKNPNLSALPLALSVPPPASLVRPVFLPSRPAAS